MEVLDRSDISTKAGMVTTVYYKRSHELDGNMELTIPSGSRLDYE